MLARVCKFALPLFWEDQLSHLNFDAFCWPVFVCVVIRFRLRSIALRLLPTRPEIAETGTEFPPAPQLFSLFVLRGTRRVAPTVFDGSTVESANYLPRFGIFLKIASKAKIRADISSLYAIRDGAATL